MPQNKLKYNQRLKKFIYLNSIIKQYNNYVKYYISTTVFIDVNDVLTMDYIDRVSYKCFAKNRSTFLSMLRK